MEEDNIEEMYELELLECYAISVMNFKDFIDMCENEYEDEKEFSKYVSKKRLKEYEEKGYFKQDLEFQEYIDKLIES